jgi:hypothetical protein
MSIKACHFLDKINERDNKTKNLSQTLLFFGGAIFITL